MSFTLCSMYDGIMLISDSREYLQHRRSPDVPWRTSGKLVWACTCKSRTTLSSFCYLHNSSRKYWACSHPCVWFAARKNSEKHWTM